MKNLPEFFKKEDCLAIKLSREQKKILHITRHFLLKFAREFVKVNPRHITSKKREWSRNKALKPAEMTLQLYSLHGIYARAYNLCMKNGISSTRLSYDPVISDPYGCI